MTAVPNLFIVGSAKAGTTWLHRVLGQHPDVHAPSVKEPHWVGRDLGLAVHAGMTSEEDYLALYQDGAASRYRLDASPSSLLSPTAADRIGEMSPGANVIIVLRNPIEVVHALHGQLALLDMQVDRDVARAADHSRTQWGAPLAGLGLHVWTRYHDVVSYSEQVVRYLDGFAPEQLHVLWFDDLRQDASAFHWDLLGRLGLSTVGADLSPTNVSSRVRSPGLQRMIAQPPFEAMLRRVVPRQLARMVRRRLFHRNVQPGVREPMPAEARASLAEDLQVEVSTLGRLLRRDLSHWCQPSVTSS